MLVAVDIGNSGIKLGRFACATDTGEFGDQLPVPSATLELPIEHATGAFDAAQLSEWCDVECERGYAAGPLAAYIEGRRRGAGRDDQFVGIAWVSYGRFDG